MSQREDNVYPRNTAHIRREPIAQQKERIKEQTAVINEYPIISQAIERFKERVAHFSSIDAISETSNEIKFMHQVEANKLAKLHFEQEINYLESLVDEYVKPIE